MLLFLISLLVYSLFSVWFVHHIWGELHSQLHLVWFIGLLAIGFLFMIKLIQEWNTFRKSWKKLELRLDKTDGYSFIALIVGAFVTFTLNHQMDIGGVLASSMIGITAAWTIREYALPTYCGSFIGMACIQIFSNPLSILIAAVISGVLYITTRHFLAGHGGKAGFIAFIGTYLSALLFGEPLRTIDSLTVNQAIWVFILAVLSSLATFAFHSFERMDNVSASALVGLTMAILYPDASHVIVLATFCGSFTGMTHKEVFSETKDIFIASVLTGFIFIVVFSLFDGTGGKLGALAFLATVATSGINTLLNFIRIRTFGRLKTVK